MRTTTRIKGCGIRGWHSIADAKAILTVFLMVAIGDVLAGPESNECSMTVTGLVDCSVGACCSRIVSGNGIRAKLVSGRIHTSSDGRMWTERLLPFQTFLRDVTYANNNFVAVGGSYFDEPGVIVTSTNGVHWTRRNTRNRIMLNSITRGNGCFVAVGDQGTILTSSNGVVWKSQRSPTQSLLAKVVFGNGVFVAGGESGTVLTWRDGVHWATTNLGASLYAGTIHFHGNAFLVSGRDISFTSTNGLTWHSDNPETTAVRSASE